MPSLTILLLMLIFAVLALCSSRTIATSTPPVPSVTPTVINANSDDFDIELGPEWKMKHEGESYIFNDEKNLRQVTIAVLRQRDSTNKTETEQLGREAIKLRQDAIRDLSNGKATFTEIRSKEVPGGFDLTFSASDLVNGVKVFSATFVRPRRIVNVSFNKYSPFPTDEELDHQFAEILSKIRVKN